MSDIGGDCIKCPSGQFSELLDANECTVCELGKTTFSNGSSVCQGCDPGYRGDNVEAGQCIICEQGQYQPEKGSVTCINCAQGQVSDTKNTACTRDTFVDEDGNEKIVPIAEDCKISLEYLDDEIQDDTYPSCLAEVGALRCLMCKVCPPGGSCTNHPSWSTPLSPLAGWWKVPLEYKPTKEEPFAKCPYESDCVVENTTSYGCAANTGGMLCSVCDAGYIRKAGICSTCVNGEIGIRVGLFASVIVIFVFVVWSSRKKLKKFHKKYASVYKDAMILVKVLVSYTQINMSLGNTMSDIMVFPNVYLLFLDRFSFVDMDILPMLGFGCIAPVPYTLTVAIAFCLPLILAVICLAMYVCFLANASGKVNRMSNIISSEPPPIVLRAQFAAYTRMKREQASNIEKLWQVYDFDHSGSLDSEEFTLMVRDLSRKSNGSKSVISIEEIFDMMVAFGGDKSGVSHQNFTTHATQLIDTPALIVEGPQSKLIALLTAKSTNLWMLKQQTFSSYLSALVQILLVFHAPISAKAFLFFDCRSIGTTSEFLNKDYSIECGGAEHAAYTPVAVGLLLGFAFGLPLLLVLLLVCNRQTLYTPGTLQKIGFLYHRYRVGAEGWDVFELCRKMTLTGVLIYIPGMARSAFSILICLVAVASLNRYKPQKNSVVFWVTQASYLCSTLKFLVVTLRSDKEDHSQQEVLGYMLIAVDIIVIASVCCSVLIVFVIFQQKVAAISKESNLVKVAPAVVPAPVVLAPVLHVHVVATAPSADHLEHDPFEEFENDQEHDPLSETRTTQQLSVAAPLSPKDVLQWNTPSSDSNDDPIALIKQFMLAAVKTPKRLHKIFNKLDSEHSHGLNKLELKKLVVSSCEKAGYNVTEKNFALLWSSIRLFETEDRPEIAVEVLEAWLFEPVAGTKEAEMQIQLLTVTRRTGSRKQHIKEVMHMDL
jgi:Ca2+-binding EF-hand superfamily protein